MDKPGQKLNYLFEQAPAISPVKMAVIHPASKESLEGALRAWEKNLIDPVFIGEAALIEQSAHAMGFDLMPHQVVSAASPKEAAQIAVQLAREGKAEALMKGDLHTDLVMSAVVDRTSGLRTDRRMSHVMLIDIPAYHKLLAFTDAAINIAPDLETKKHIVQNAIDLMQSIGVSQPKVACISATEAVYDKMPSSIDGNALQQMSTEGAITGGVVEGPIGIDIALSKNAAAIKRRCSKVSGDADIVVVPNIEAGNVLVKSIDILAGGVSAGIVIGAAVPIVMTSRSASATSRLGSCILAQFFAKWMRSQR